MEQPKSLERVRHVILILSGKGGVGKSSVTTHTALLLALRGFSVGILDIDLTGPSMPRMLGVESKQVHQSSAGWVPVTVYEADSSRGQGRIQLMSLGFLLGGRGSSVVWRGPKKTAMIRQFLRDVVWTLSESDHLDYLLVDTPPGTSDEHIAIAEELRYANPDGAIVVTTPQQVATADVRKEINFCHKAALPVLGVVENMAGFVCPFCAECTDIFLSGGGKTLCDTLGLAYLGNIPIDPSFVDMVECQSSEARLIDVWRESALRGIVDGITDKLMATKEPLTAINTSTATKEPSI